MHVDTHQLQLMALHHRQRLRQIGMPDTVFAVFAAGIGFLAVAVTKARIHAQPDAMARRDLSKLIEHINGTGVDRNA